MTRVDSKFLEPKEIDAGNSGSAITLSLKRETRWKVMLTGNPVITLSNPNTGTAYLIRLVQDSIAGRTVTWPDNVLWQSSAPTLSGAGKQDFIWLYYDGSYFYGKADLGYDYLGVIPEFDPLSLTGLVGLFQADAITGLSDGDSVTSWSDGSGGSALNTTSYAWPIYKVSIVNGKPVVRFATGSQQAINYTSNRTDIRTACVVYKNVTADASYLATMSYGSDITWHAGGGTYVIDSGYASANITGGSAYVNNSSTTPSLVERPTTFKSVLFTTLAGVNFFGVGQGNTSGRYLDGDVAELILLNSVISTAERNALYSYHSSKYAL